jgi:methylmalonyl-CoA mutase N-terminal domain/subunit
MQNDPLKEFTARGTEIYGPEQAVRIACDCVAFALDQGLRGAAITVCSNHYDVAGAGPVVAVAFAFANAFVYIDELVGRGYGLSDVLEKMMFFLNERSDLWVTASLFRTARTVWADLVEERYGLTVEKQPAMTLMGYAHGLESADEPLVSIPRVTLSVLGAMLGGVDYLCATGYDEAIRVPSADAAALAVRTMQVVAHEHGVLASIDPLDGGRKTESLDRELEAQLRAEMKRLHEAGGALEALHNGYIAGRIDEGRGTRQRQLELGQREMVGHNVYEAPGQRHLFAGQSAGEIRFEEVERAARDRLELHKAQRDDASVMRALAMVTDAASGTDNLLPPTVEALRAGATTQEIVDATRKGFER